MQRQRYRTWILASTLLLAGSGAIWIATHIANRARLQPLLKRATPVTDCVPSEYDWLSADQLLIERQKPGISGVFGRMVVHLDRRTGQYTPIAAINGNPVKMVTWSDSSLSPDGRHLLLPREDRTGNYLVEAVDLNNGSVRDYRPWQNAPGLSPVSNLLWQPDGRRWVELSIGSHVPRRLVALVGQANGSRPNGGASFKCPTSVAFWDSVGASLLGFIGPDRVLALPKFSLFDSHRNGLRLFEFTVTGQPKIREYSLHLPQESRALNVALSPNGIHLVVTLQMVNRPTLSPLQQLLANWMPNLRTKSDLVVVLYTVRRDGTGWHGLGTMPSTDDNDRTFDNRYFRLRWLPGGHQVSFIYHEKLWKVDAQ